MAGSLKVKPLQSPRCNPSPIVWWLLDQLHPAWERLGQRRDAAGTRKVAERPGAGLGTRAAAP